VHGVTYDGQNVWFAAGDTLNAFDPASGQTGRSIDVAAHAGTAFDGQYLFQLAEDRIQKIDPESGHVLATIPGRHARRECRHPLDSLCQSAAPEGIHHQIAG
jgi:glutamine cyclotransferase